MDRRIRGVAKRLGLALGTEERRRRQGIKDKTQWEKGNRYDEERENETRLC